MLPVLLLWSAQALALDPGKLITQYARDVWQSDDGLPQDSIYAVAQTRVPVARHRRTS